MKISTRAGFSLLIGAALLLLALGAGILVKWSVERNMVAEARRNSTGAISLAATGALDFYRDNFRIKTDQALQLKRRMAMSGRIIAGLTSRQLSPEAFVSAFPMREEDSLVVYKENHVYATKGLFNANPYLLHDIKGELVGPTMASLARGGRSASCVVQIPGEGGRTAHYFGTHFYVAQWDMMVGLWTDIGHLEEAQRVLFARNLENLRNRYDKVNFGASGFIFVADGQGKPVIVPGSDGYGLALGHMAGLSAKDVVDVKILDSAVEYPDMQVIFDPPWDNKSRMAWLTAHYVKPLDWYVGGVIFIDEVVAPAEKLSMAIFLGIGAVAVLIFLATYFFAGWLTAPLASLAHYARNVPKEDFLAEKPSSELLESLARRGSANEVAHLAMSFRFMDTALRTRVRELMETTAGRERMAGELAAARDIQMDLLPAPLPDNVVASRFSLWAMLEPAREVGGDLYDYFMTDENHLCVVVGDVSDKGVPAALFMSVALTLVRSGAAPGVSAAELMGKVNNTLARNNYRDMFVTMFIGILDLRTGEFNYANGGHCRPLLLAGGGASQIEGRSGVSLGIRPGVDYKPLSVRLAPGDTLLLYTDGVDEAMNGQDEILGRERLLAEAGRLSGLAPEDVGKGVRKLVFEHIGEHSASDDITTLVLRYEVNAKCQS